MRFFRYTIVRVLPTTYNGNLNLNVRNHTISDYYFVVMDEQTDKYSSYLITEASATYDSNDNDLTLPVNLSLVEGRFYICFVFPQDGSLADSSGVSQEFWADFEALKTAGTISDDIIRFKIYSTNQTNFDHYTTNNGTFTEPSGYSEDVIVLP